MHACQLQPSDSENTDSSPSHEYLVARMDTLSPLVSIQVSGIIHLHAYNQIQPSDSEDTSYEDSISPLPSPMPPLNQFTPMKKRLRHVVCVRAPPPPLPIDLHMVYTPFPIACTLGLYNRRR